MLQSTYRRAGAPAIFAFGAKREGNALKAGMLILSAQLDPIPYDLFDPNDPDAAHVRVRLPKELTDLSDDKFIPNATLEVAP